MSGYREFIANKSQSSSNSGFDPIWMPDFLFDFQKHLVEWSIRKGRDAIFADCGLGKTPMQLVWSQNVVEKTNGNVLVLAPLAVVAQTVREAEKFGIEAKASRDGSVTSKITVTNYESLHKFNASDFAGAVPDEVSCLKAFDGKRRKQVTRFMSKMEYRLGCTATAAPNDFIELGTIAEALGVMTQSDMLGTFFLSSDKKRHSLFKEGDFWNRAKYFFRAHSEVPFWRWVCSWAISLRKPSDLGFEDGAFVLPPLEVTQHVVPTKFRFPGELFVRVARTLKEQREERKRSMIERCEMAAKLVDHNEPAVVWCQYNEEGDRLEKMIPGAVQVAGCNSDDEKAERLNGFSKGDFRVLVSKPKLASFGLNWQHCGHQTFFPSHSFEQWYQAIRRSLRFGRVGPVRVDVVATEGESGVTDNLQKKERKAEEMFAALIEHMRHGAAMQLPNKHINEMELPTWLSSTSA